MTAAAPPDPLPLLAELLGEMLGGPRPATALVHDAQVALAQRHQVGPLLHAAVTAHHHAISAEGAAALARDDQESRVRRASSLARLDRIGREFAARNIGWMALKGTTQAAQLYPDPAWRFSADIDVLVASQDFASALSALESMRFIPSYPPLPKNPLLRKTGLPLLRDVTLIAADDHNCAVELHHRLFLAGGPANALTFPVAPGPIPTPALGPELAFYLIAHGALSGWVRLKWLVDLVPLFAKLDDASRADVCDLACAARAESAVAASLLLLREMFPFAALGPLIPWLEKEAQRPAVVRRLRRYRDMLSGDGYRRSPLDHAWAALESNFLLFEAPSTRARLLLAAPISSALRRIAGRFYAAERSLTLPPSGPASMPAIQRDTP